MEGAVILILLILFLLNMVDFINEGGLKHIFSKRLFYMVMTGLMFVIYLIFNLYIIERNILVKTQNGEVKTPHSHGQRQTKIEEFSLSKIKN